MITHKVYFQINGNEPKEFAEIEDSKPFTMTFEKHLTEEELNEIKKINPKFTNLHFEDARGNTFDIFSKPVK